jgi:hypothetical protein
MNKNIFAQALVLLVLILGDAGMAFAANNVRNNDGRTNYSGASMKCLVANDFYAVHFSAMQLGRQSGEPSDYMKYCQEIPVAGLTFLTLDMLDRDVRSLPIALQLVQEELDANGMPMNHKVLLEIPSKIYKSGTADTKYEFTAPGHYAVIAVFGDPNDGVVSEDDRLRIPFTVAMTGATTVPWLKYAFWICMLGVIAASIYFGHMFYVRYWQDLFRHRSASGH